MVVFRKKSRNTPVKTLENDTVYGERPWKWYSVHDSSLLGQLARCQTNQQNLLCLATSQLITHIPHLQKNLNEWFQLHLWIETNFTLAATGNPCESYNGIFSLNFWKKSRQNIETRKLWKELAWEKSLFHVNYYHSKTRCMLSLFLKPFFFALKTESPLYYFTKNYSLCIGPLSLKFEPIGIEQR